MSIPDQAHVQDLLRPHEAALTGTVQGRNVELRGFNAGSLVGQVEVGVSVFAPSATSFTLEQMTALLTKATERTKAASASTQTLPSLSSSTPPASSTTSAAAAGLSVIDVPGYSYTALPAELRQMADGMVTTGMITERNEARNRKITTTTMSTASPSVFSTSSIDDWMNLVES